MPQRPSPAGRVLRHGGRPAAGPVEGADAAADAGARDRRRGCGLRPRGRRRRRGGEVRGLPLDRLRRLRHLRIGARAPVPAAACPRGHPGGRVQRQRARPASPIPVRRRRSAGDPRLHLRLLGAHRLRRGAEGPGAGRRAPARHHRSRRRRLRGPAARAGADRRLHRRRRRRRRDPRRRGRGGGRGRRRPRPGRGQADPPGHRRRGRRGHRLRGVGEQRRPRARRSRHRRPARRRGALRGRAPGVAPALAAAQPHRAGVVRRQPRGDARADAAGRVGAGPVHPGSAASLRRRSGGPRRSPAGRAVGRIVLAS